MTILQERLQEIDSMRYGPQRTLAATEAVELAQESRDLQLEYDARYLLTVSALYSGEGELVLANLPWLLTQHDQDPSLGDERSLVWSYKWFLHLAVNIPSLSLERLESFLDDFAQRAGRLRMGAQAEDKLRWSAARRAGQKDMASVHYEAWKSSSRDDLSDCEACDVSSEAAYLASLEPQHALKVLQPVLSGELSCTDEPHYALTTAMEIHQDLGHLQEALDLHMRGYRMVLHNPDFLGPVCDHIVFLAETGNIARAETLARRHRPWAERTRMPTLKLDYLGALGSLVVAAQRLEYPLSLTLLGEVSATSDKDALLDALVRSGRQITALFDARNNNTFVTDTFLEGVHRSGSTAHAPLLEFVPVVAQDAPSAQMPPMPGATTDRVSFYRTVGLWSVALDVLERSVPTELTRARRRDLAHLALLRDPSRAQMHVEALPSGPERFLLALWDDPERSAEASALVAAMDLPGDEGASLDLMLRGKTDTVTLRELQEEATAWDNPGLFSSVLRSFCHNQDLGADNVRALMRVALEQCSVLPRDAQELHQAAWQMLLGHQHAAAGDFPAAVEQVSSARTVFAHHSTGHHLNATSFLGQLHTHMGKETQALSLLTAAYHHPALESKERPYLARSIAHNLGNMERRPEAVALLSDLLTEDIAIELRRDVLDMLGFFLWREEDYDESIRHYDLSIDLVQEKDPGQAAATSIAVAQHLRDLEHPRCADRFMQAATFLSRCEDPQREFSLLRQSAYLYNLFSREDEAYAATDAALALHARNPEVVTDVQLANLYLLRADIQKDLENAMRFEENVVLALNTSDAPFVAAESQRLWGELFCQRGEIPAAIKYYESAAELLQVEEDHAAEYGVRQILLDLHDAAGDKDQVLIHSERMVALEELAEDAEA